MENLHEWVNIVLVLAIAVGGFAYRSLKAEMDRQREQNDSEHTVLHTRISDKDDKLDKLISEFHAFKNETTQKLSRIETLLESVLNERERSQ